METQQDLFLQHCSRLQTVREEKNKKMEAILGKQMIYVISK